MNKKIYRGLAAVTSVYLLYLGLCSFLTFDTSWDFLAYHLPHSLKLFNLTTFSNGPFLESVTDGIPPLAHLAQGFLIFIFQRYSAANFINYLGLLSLIIYAWKRLPLDGISLLFFTLTVLSIPLVQIHTTTGYIDLWSNIPITLSLFELMIALDFRLTTSYRRFIPSLFSTGILVSFLSKYQMWPFCLVVSMLYLYKFITFQNEKLTRKIFYSTLLGLGISIWPLRNHILYENPMYPLKTPILQKYFPNHKLDTSNISNQEPENIKAAPGIIKFIYSSFEISRFTGPQTLTWSIDQYAEGGPSNPNHRMGGWNIVTVVIFTAFLVSLAKTYRLPVLIFSLFFALVGFAPQSHELRYWLFIPLLASLLAAFGFNSLERKTYRDILLIVMFINFTFVSINVSRKLDSAPPSTYAPQKAKIFWSNANPDIKYSICDIPNGIFYAGPNFKEFSIQECY